MRLLLIGAIVVSAAGGHAAVAAPATDYDVQPVVLDVTTGPAGELACAVDADLYVPAGASRRHPVPAILATNGFGGDKRGLSVIAGAYARRGYAFLAYSGLGFGNSGCKIFLDDPDYDGKAGSQLISYLGGSKADRAGRRIDFVQRDAVDHAGRRRSDDPRVGMLNGSYGGQVQFAVAAQDARLDAISPAHTWNDLAYSLAPNNTDLAAGVSSRTPGVVKTDWPAIFTAAGLLGLRSGDPGRLGPCPNFEDRVCAALTRALATGYPAPDVVAMLRHASVSSYVQRIRIPTLLTQGQHDTLFNLQESVATYQALRRQGTPVSLIWTSTGHSGGGLGTSELDPANPERAYQSRMELAFFEHHLKGRGPAPRGFSFFRRWVPYQGDAAPAVATAERYPAATTRAVLLSGSDALVADPRAAQDGAAQLAVLPAPGGTGGGSQDVGSTDLPATTATFSTPALPEDLDVVGVPALTLHLDAPSFAQTQGTGPEGQLVLSVKLLDVDPSGGTTVLPANLVSAVRVRDVTQPVRLELPGIVHRFAEGHQLRLAVSASSATARGSAGAGLVRILVARDRPSALELPVLTSPAGRAGSGPFGTTPLRARG